mmetsp:Transcript_39253/g.93942  ORF Transcript_39253/g.93942 Transcript_39253/m.93942 type:complete len:241 (+) Transcript_39253:181-903(+)
MRGGLPLAVDDLCGDVGRERGLPLVAVLEQLLLVVEQLLVRLRRVLEVGPLDDGVHRAGLLAEAAVDALGHVDVVARGAPRAVLTHLRLDGDGLRRADGLAQLARDAPLVAARVASQRVLASEARREVSLLEGVVDGGLLLEQLEEGERHAADQLAHEQLAGRVHQDGVSTSRALLVRVLDRRRVEAAVPPPVALRLHRRLLRAQRPPPPEHRGPRSPQSGEPHAARSQRPQHHPAGALM